MAVAEQKAFDGGNLNLIALNENLISPSARPPAPELISDEHNRSGGRKRGREGRRWGRGFVILNTINPPNFRPLGTFSPPPRHPSIHRSAPASWSSSTPSLLQRHSYEICLLRSAMQTIQTHIKESESLVPKFCYCRFLLCLWFRVFQSYRRWSVVLARPACQPVCLSV